MVTLLIFISPCPGKDLTIYFTTKHCLLIWSQHWEEMFNRLLFTLGIYGIRNKLIVSNRAWQTGIYGEEELSEMDEYNEIIFYLLVWLAFWLIIQIKTLFTCGMRIYLNYMSSNGMISMLWKIAESAYVYEIWTPGRATELFKSSWAFEQFLIFCQSLTFDLSIARQQKLFIQDSYVNMSNEFIRKCSVIAMHRRRRWSALLELLTCRSM